MQQDISICELLFINNVYIVKIFKLSTYAGGSFGVVTMMTVGCHDF